MAHNPQENGQNCPHSPENGPMGATLRGKLVIVGEGVYPRTGRCVEHRNGRIALMFRSGRISWYDDKYAIAIIEEGA